VKNLPPTAADSRVPAKAPTFPSFAERKRLLSVFTFLFKMAVSRMLWTGFYVPSNTYALVEMVYQSAAETNGRSNERIDADFIIHTCCSDCKKDRGWRTEELEAETLKKGWGSYIHGKITK
jgi:hypothetical protein